MNGGKKHVGTRHGILEKKRRGQCIALTVVVLITMILFSILNQPRSNQPTGQVFQFKAAIVDQGSLSPAAGPNPVFVETATNILSQAGFTVDYCPSEDVTVDFYRNLPKQGYGLIILRVHSSATYREGIRAPVVFFTSEPYSRTKYVNEQLAEQLCVCAFSQEDREKGIEYFGITPLFVSDAIGGNFQNSIIVMMGCEGLNNTLMAEAFVERGARVYISWSGGVLASHTDTATEHLLQHFLIEKKKLKQSVQETFKEVGFDPLYNSLLIYYPLQAGEQTIQDLTGNPARKP